MALSLSAANGQSRCLCIGLEDAGIVVETGPNVEGLAPSDHMVPSFVASCGRCGMCREGRPALCQPASVANMAVGRSLNVSGSFAQKEVHSSLGLCAALVAGEFLMGRTLA